jgi:PAS domain S-box-containing protein
VQGEWLIEFPDTVEEFSRSGDPHAKGAVEAGVRSAIWVAIVKEGVTVGAFAIGRSVIGTFSDKQIALLQNFAAQAVIAMKNARLLEELRQRTTDLQESLEYQTATSDVLKVISRTTFDLQPTLATLIETAARLCDAQTAGFSAREGGAYRIMATYSNAPAFDKFIRGRLFAASRTSVTGRTALEGQIVHIADLAADPEYAVTEAVTLGGVRTGLGVPLLREGEVTGVIILGRMRVHPFTDQQIELVRTFADQALIAIENTRLLTEQREALEQQTATAEVLQVINASPGNLAPVFDAILEKAHNLCSADHGSLYISEGEAFRAVAVRGMPDEFSDLIRRAFHPGPNHPVRQLIAGATFAVAHDAHEIDDRIIQQSVKLAGMRSALFVPLRKDELLLGYIVASSPERRAFADKQVALLQNFAAQAVIAMDNARLLTETREALERQTATAEVLGIINANPGNLTPVFDAILKKAHALCGAAFGSLYTFDGERLHSVAHRNVPAAYAEYRERNPPRPMPGSGLFRFLQTKRPVQELDIISTEAYRTGHANTRAMVELGGIRTIAAVPLLKDDALVGMISIFRQEVQAFSDRQIALLENFAAQAVIAMENARLINETREALEQQTATAEVLQVINASPGNLAPVFDAMLERAMRLCGASFGSFYTYDGEQFLFTAQRGLPEAFAEFRAQNPLKPVPGSQLARAIENRQTLQVLDLKAEDLYREGNRFVRAMADLGGVRTILVVPLCKDETVLGFLSVYRQEVRAFSDRQIELLENFAAQAVIAMENARLLEEVRQRQEELRVTFENMGDGVAMFDETQRLVAWNGKFQEIFDLPDDLLEQHRTYEEHLRFLAARGDFGVGVETVERIDELVATTGQPYGYEGTRPDGRVIEIRRNPVPDGGFVLIFSDITERKRSEAEIRSARDAAEAAYRDLKAVQANLIQAEKMASLGQLTAGIAHEIKNPLNFVNNFAALSVDLLSELKQTAAPGFAALSEQQRAEVEDVSTMLTGNLEKITEHGRRADGIVKAMLEHSRGSSSERRMVDLNALIEEALNLAYHGARAQDQTFNITLERDFGAGIAPIELNPQDITRAFLNLFSNALYATTRRARDGGDAGFEPTLKVTTRTAGDVVEIRVRDNGTGIPIDIRDKLFQPFFTTKPTGEGTGLGLSITYDIVTQQHGGSIAVDSKVGEYSEFVIRLPRGR